MLGKHRANMTGSEEKVLYLDGSVLLRPLKLPRIQLAIALLFVLTAAGIGWIALSNVLERVVYSNERINANINKIAGSNVELDLPVLRDLIWWEDQAIRDAFANNSLPTYERSTDEYGNILGFDVVKLPDGVSTTDATTAYTQGFSQIDPVDAVRMLHGSWRMTIDRSDGVSMKVRYGDFASESIEQAIKTAMVSENLDKTTLGSTGIDGAGNTYQQGEYTDDQNTVYHWQISACPLSEAYNVSGLPKNSFYVGIHLWV